MPKIKNFLKIQGLMKVHKIYILKINLKLKILRKNRQLKNKQKILLVANRYLYC